MNHRWLEYAVQLAEKQAKGGKGGPFGAIVVKNDQIIGEGFNQVTSLNDPSAHAEVQAIRAACKTLGHFQLNDCEIYSSCEPCPMCLGAIYWARPSAVYFAADRFDAATAGFDDQFIYNEILLSVDKRSIPTHCIRVQTSLNPFEAWNQNSNKTPY